MIKRIFVRSGMLLALASVLLLLNACQTSGTRSNARWAEHEEEERGPPDGDYWAMRVAYPTGHFEPQWLKEAAKQDALIASAVPAGSKSYRRSALSPMTLTPNQFTPIGPQPLNDNGFGFGHVSGRANVLAVDPVQTSVAYAGSDGGGVWKTTNCCSAATTWTVKTDIPQLATIAVDDISIDPNNHMVVYAATGDLNYGSFSFGAAGILKSVDQGETWVELGADVFTPFYGPSAGGFPQYQAVSKVVIDPNNSNNLIAGTKTGVFFSYDAGSNWSGPCYTNTFNTQRQDTTGLLAVNNTGSTTVYAAVGTRGNPTPVQPDLVNNGANGVYQTSMPTSGCPSSWTLSNVGWPTGTGNGVANTSRGRIELAVAPTDHQTLYAMVSNVATNGVLGVWKTNNGGVSWTAAATSAGFGGCDTPGTQMWYDAGLTVDPNNANTVFMSGVDVFRSTNGGTSFTNLTCGYQGGNAGTITHVDQHARAFVGTDSSKLLIGSDGGVYYSSNANAATVANVAFTPINDSLNTIEIYSGDITGNFATAANPGATGGFQDNGSGSVQFAGTPSATVWQSTNGGDGMFSRIEPVLGQRWYTSVYYGAIAISKTGPFGTMTTAYGAWGQGSPTTTDRKGFLMPFDLYRYGDTSVAGSGCDTTSGCSHLIAGTYRVWESLNGASSSTAASRWAAKTGDVTKNNLILGTDNRSYINQVHYSVSDVRVAMTASNDGNVEYIFGLGTAAAATSVNVTGGNVVLPNRPIQNVATDPNDPLIGYAAVGGFDQNTAATPGHVFRVTCTTNCATFGWDNKTGNLPNIPVNAIIANPHLPSQIFVGTDWGLYFTNDITAASPVWQRFENLPHAMVWDLVIDRGFTTLAVFTRSRGAWVWPLPTAAIGGSADLEISISAASIVQAGKTLSYTTTLTNHGPDVASNVVVSNSTPAGLGFVGNSGDCSGVFPCSFASVASGASKIITTTLCVPSTYTGANPIITAASASSDVSDPATGNNSASANTALDLDAIFINGFEACP
ncbi:DUF11 domain-containing protein [Pseudolysobacter antarcticus]|uniref:DUF11 domain-containing protein n=1 Tax=Pseudolysobacter antarcticus TaxID=2511995 RepID=A0A411HER3_9GAMM|nr:DUF11 domain-containing protein [Pseudolysobacter antarcticus]QBB68980.1 DUF11 domain-containing protein [Pseudolysobacter antarcticus]